MTQTGHYALILITALLGLQRCVASSGGGTETDVRNLITPARGFTPAHSYLLDDIESIDLATGALGIRLPLASLPPGPAGFTAGFTLVYSGKYWQVSPENPDNGGPIYNLDASPQGGWRLAYGYQLEIEHVPAKVGTCFYDETQHYSYQKLTIVSPDGSRHLMSLSGPCDGLSSSFGQDTDTGTHLQQHWFSTDGSYLRLVIHDGNNHGWLSLPRTIYLPDGTSVKDNFDTGVQILEDRNGNQIHISKTHPDGKTLVTIQDDGGHSVSATTDYLGPNNTRRDTLSAKGFDDQTLEWQIEWGRPKDGSDPVVVNPQDEYDHFVWYHCELRVPDYEWYCSSDGAVSIVDRVQLPNGLSYSFQHNAFLGHLNQITMPTGATVSYSWKLDEKRPPNGQTITQAALQQNLTWYEILENAPTSKTLSYREKNSDSSAKTQRWTYEFGRTGSMLTRPDGGNVTTATYRTDYRRSAIHPRAGSVYRTISADGTIHERIWAANNTVNSIHMDGFANPWVAQEYTTLVSGSSKIKTMVKDYAMDSNGNTTSIAEYDWLDSSAIGWWDVNELLPKGVPSGAVPVRVQTMTPKDPTSAADARDSNANAYYKPTAPRFIRLIASKDTTGVGPARHESFTYYATGNLHEQSVQNSIDNSLLTTSLEYDSKGRITKTTDPRLFETTSSYAQACPQPTTVARQIQGQEKLTETFQYDSSTCLKTLHTDANGASTSWFYDSYGRVTSIVDGGVAGQYAAYDDTERWMAIRRDFDGETGSRRQTAAITYFDQLGRPRLERRLETEVLETASSTTLASDEASGIKIRIEYDDPASAARRKLVSNPYSGDSTSGWTVTTYDTSDRVVLTESFDGATEPAATDSGQGRSTGKVQTRYDVSNDGQRTQVIDQSLKTRQTYADGLGRLTRVVEAPGAENYVTLYRYDHRDKLTEVCQGGMWNGMACQNGLGRTFGYSSLGWLTSATNPESGTTSYTYDNNGNLRTKTDQASNRVTYAYDGLNRILSKTYEHPNEHNQWIQAMPPVAFCYDGKILSGGTCALSAGIANAKGRLTHTYTSGSEELIAGYDVLGRVVGSTQKTDGIPYPFSYTYNLAGSPVGITYPSGNVTTHCYDVAGRVSLVHKGPLSADQCSTAAANNYAEQIEYAPHGAVEAMTLGNGLAEVTAYNSRLQPISITAGNVFSLGYGYGLPGANNGNIGSQTITVPSQSVAFSQSYEYDGINRLTKAQETATGQTGWTQEYVYDNFGNRAVYLAAGRYIPDASGTPQVASKTEAAVASIFPNNQWIGAQYDGVGNAKAIPDHNFTYDAENRLQTATKGGLTTTYSYDGAGRRVKKQATGETVATVYVYDAGGSLAAEYGRPTTTGLCTTCYLTVDHLGSTRLMTASNGSTDPGQPKYVVKARYDYLPFGEEIGAAIDGRGQQYDKVEPSQKFTGKERDAETGLDYFGARYFSASQGRWMSPDEFKGGIVNPFTGQQVGDPGPLPYADITDPQTFNKYGYVRNNPLRYFDPDGHSEHEGAGKLVQDWLDVVEVRASANVGAGAGGQCGVAEARVEYTLIGIEGKTGLGGGNAEARTLTQFKVAGKVGTVGAEAKLGAEISTKNGTSAEAKFESQAGPGSASLGVRAGPGGTQPTSTIKASSDFKLGVDVKLGVGIGVGINVSQIGRAYENTAAAAKSTATTVTNVVSRTVNDLTPWLPK